MELSPYVNTTMFRIIVNIWIKHKYTNDHYIRGKVLPVSFVRRTTHERVRQHNFPQGSTNAFFFNPKLQHWRLVVRCIRGETYRCRQQHAAAVHDDYVHTASTPCHTKQPRLLAGVGEVSQVRSVQGAVRRARAVSARSCTTRSQQHNDTRYRCTWYFAGSRSF